MTNLFKNNIDQEDMIHNLAQKFNRKQVQIADIENRFRNWTIPREYKKTDL